MQGRPEGGEKIRKTASCIHIMVSFFLNSDAASNS